MGRKSVLADKQWDEIANRLLMNNERPADLAKEFGIHRSQITRRFSAQLQNVKDVANQIVAADVALKSLPVAQQLQVLTLADELRAISSHLASAAKHGAMTARRLSVLAHEQTEYLDPTKPEGNVETLKNVMVLTKTANEAASTGLTLLAANKEIANKPDGADSKPRSRADFYETNA